MLCRKLALLLLTAALVPWLGGCALLSSLTETPQYVLTLHQVVKSSNPDLSRVMMLTTFTGKTVMVRISPLLSSCQFRQIATVAEPGKPIALNVFLDPHGGLAWTVIRRDLVGQEFAVAVDGWCHGIWTIPAMTTATDTVICLPGPWDKAVADAVVRHAKGNYSSMSSAQPK